MRPFEGRFLVAGRTGASNGRTAVAPPWIAFALPLVKSLRIIVLLPLGFLSRASTVLSLSFLCVHIGKGYMSTSVIYYSFWYPYDFSDRRILSSIPHSQVFPDVV